MFILSIDQSAASLLYQSSVRTHQELLSDWSISKCCALIGKSKVNDHRMDQCCCKKKIYI